MGIDRTRPKQGACDCSLRERCSHYPGSGAWLIPDSSFTVELGCKKFLLTVDCNYDSMMLERETK